MSFTPPSGSGITVLEPQTLGMPPPPQVWTPVHATHGAAMPPPHPSACWPHRLATVGSAQVLGVHTGPPPQTLGVPPPPQDCPLAQVPQEARIPPHPSATGPQLAP